MARELALVGGGEEQEEMVRNDKLEHRIAEELEALVVRVDLVRVRVRVRVRNPDPTLIPTLTITDRRGT